MARVRRSRRIWRNSFMAMAHMPTAPPGRRIHQWVKSTSNEISGQEETAPDGPGAVLGQASVVVALDLGRRQLAGGPLPQLAGLLGSTLGELGHLVLHLLAGLLYLAGGCC